MVKEFSFDLFSRAEVGSVPFRRGCDSDFCSDFAKWRLNEKSPSICDLDTWRFPRWCHQNCSEYGINLIIR